MLWLFASLSLLMIVSRALYLTLISVKCRSYHRILFLPTAALCALCAIMSFQPALFCFCIHYIVISVPNSWYTPVSRYFVWNNWCRIQSISYKWDNPVLVYLLFAAFIVAGILAGFLVDVNVHAVAHPVDAEGSFESVISSVQNLQLDIDSSVTSRTLASEPQIALYS